MITKPPWFLLILLFLLSLITVSCQRDEGAGRPDSPDTPRPSAFASAVIVAATGGMVTVPASHPLAGTSIAIPAGALAADTVISISEAPPPGPPGAIGPAIDIGPNGTVFRLPATVTLVYDKAALAPDTVEAHLSITKIEASGVETPLTDVTVDTANHRIWGHTSSLSVFAVVSGENRPPVADAGSAQTVALGATVRLDGSQSSDVDGDVLTFAWSFMTKPAGSVATLSDPNAVRPTFVVDRPGTYVARLIVNDGVFSSAPAMVTIQSASTVTIESFPVGAGTGHLGTPEVAINDNGVIITAYPIDGSLYARTFQFGVWSDRVLIADEREFFYDGTRAAAIALNAVGQAALVFQKPSPGFGITLFGFAYFDSVQWSYVQSVFGSFGFFADPWRNDPGPVTIDANGTAYVIARRLAITFFPPSYLQFGPGGLISTTPSSDQVTNVYWAANRHAALAVGSPSFALSFPPSLLAVARLFESGTTTRFDIPNTGVIEDAMLQYRDDGHAELVVLPAGLHYQFDGVGWQLKQALGSFASRTYAAANDRGQIVVTTPASATASGTTAVLAYYFDGAEWHSPVTLDTGVNAGTDSARVLTDGQRFLVLSIEGSLRAFSFDGMWHGPFASGVEASDLRPAVAMNRFGTLVIVQKVGIGGDDNLVVRLQSVHP